MTGDDALHGSEADPGAGEIGADMEVRAP